LLRRLVEREPEQRLILGHRTILAAEGPRRLFTLGHVFIWIDPTDKGVEALVQSRQWQVEIESQWRLETVVLIPKYGWRKAAESLPILRFISGRAEGLIYTHSTVPESVVHSLAGTVEPSCSIGRIGRWWTWR